MSTQTRNHHITCDSPEQLDALRDEYENYVGRDTVTDAGSLTLTVLALPKKYKRKTALENKLQRQRRERDASFVDYDEYSDYEDRDY